MDRQGSVYSDDDYMRIAELHRDLLEGSIISALGTTVLNAYYRFINNSGQEQLFTIREQNTIVGAAVLSHSPTTVTSRMVKSNLVTVGRGMLQCLLANPGGSNKVWHYLFSRGLRPDKIEGMPEVIQIFADAGYSNKKIGTRLLSQVEEYLSHKNIHKYFVKTINDADNFALLFYRRRGFVKVGSGMESGKKYVFLLKSLDSFSG